MKPYRIMECGRTAVGHLIHTHYLHSWPGTVVACLALVDKNVIPIGAITFSLPPRETSKRFGVMCWELSRLFILDTTPKNAESWFVSRAIKWVMENRPDVGALVSYADPAAGHNGTIYRASNWIFDDMTDAGRKTPRCDYWVLDKKYSRKSHVPEGAEYERRARGQKFRFVYYLDGSQENRRQNAISKAKALK